MKKTMVLLVSMATLLFACNHANKQENNSGYTINGTLTGITNGTVKLVAENINNRTSRDIDSATITNGSFELKGSVAVPQMMSLLINPGNWSFNVFVEDTTITVKADTTGSIHYDYTAYGGSKGAMIKNFTETGSKIWDAWMAYQNAPGQKQYDPVFKILDNKIETAKNIDTEYAYRDQADSVRKLLQTWQKSWIDSFVNINPSSVAGVYMFWQLFQYSQNMQVSEMGNTLNKFKGEATASVYYKTLDSSLNMMKAVQPGSIAPDFTLLKRDSSKFTLSSLRGNYVMIDFWASWCHPCRQAIPHWKEIYKKYHEKGFDIVSVSDDDHWSAWFKALDQEKMPWTQVCDEFPVKNMPARVGSLYMTTYIPFYVLLDKQGKILVYTGDENKIDAKLKEIFGS